MAEKKLTNLSYLEELGMGDDELLIEMIEMFLDNTPQTLQNLRTHNADENWKKLSAEAHKFKPNLSYVGLDEARKIIVDIEAMAKSDSQPEGFEDDIDRVEDICEEAYRELKVQLEKLKS